MIISFFEEFPKEGLSKIKLVNWQTKLYLAAGSLKEFEEIKSKINNKFVKEFVYWPILDIKEGYWISPFSQREAIFRISEEIRKSRIPVMIDSELPTTKNPILYATQLFNFFRNKKLITDLIKKHDKVYVAEYYPDGKINDKILGTLGLHFDSRKFGNKIIKMLYHSMHKPDEEFITNELRRCKKEFGDNLVLAYGTIAKGINGNEKILGCEQLRKDLSLAEKIGVKEVIIYRLGGLNKEYCKVIKEFS